MEMRKRQGIDEIRDCLRRSVLCGSPFELSLVQHTDDASVIANWPTAVLTGQSQLQRVTDARHSRQCFHGTPHDLPHLSSSSLLPRGGTRQVNPILTGQRVVYRFTL